MYTRIIQFVSPEGGVVNKKEMAREMVHLGVIRNILPYYAEVALWCIEIGEGV